MRAFGADLEIVPSDGGKVTPALFDRFKARIAELAKDPNTFWTNQFNNADALEGYAGIGRELVEQIGRVDAFVGAVGTAGMSSAPRTFCCPVSTICAYIGDLLRRVEPANRGYRANAKSYDTVSPCSPRNSPAIASTRITFRNDYSRVCGDDQE